MRPIDRASIESLETRRLLSADLRTAFSGGWPSEIEPGESTRISVRVRNLGDTLAKPVTVNVYASTDGTLDGSDRLLGSTTRGKSIKAGRSAIVKVALSLPPDLADGNYQLIAEAADGSGVADANPADNVAAGPGPIALRQPFVDLGLAVTGQPRGAISTVGRDGGEAPPATVRIDVFNAGNAVADGSASVALYLSQSGTLDASAVPLADDGSRDFHLKPDAARCVKIRFRVPAAVTAGDYTLFAVLTPDAALGDTNAANDVAAAPVEVTVVNTPLPRPRIYCFPHHYEFGGGDDGIVYEDIPVIEDSGEPLTWEDVLPPAPVPDDPEPWYPDPDPDPSTQPSDPPSTQPMPDDGNDWTGGGGGGNEDTGGVDYTGGETDTGWSGSGSDFGSDSGSDSGSSYGGDFGWGDDEW